VASPSGWLCFLLRISRKEGFSKKDEKPLLPGNAFLGEEA